MDTNENSTSEKLLKSLINLKRLNWSKSPIPGLTPGEIRALFTLDKTCLEESNGSKVSDISRILKVAPPTVTLMITTMERKGYVKRIVDKNDRRAVSITLTKKGIEAVTIAKETFFKAMNNLVEYLGEDNSLKLAELLSQVSTYFDKSYENYF
ncbi:MAG TPA: MarR family transcriptional regulator [Clostridiaceae bacterium]